jgi:sterol desaturase/sphingolipid hydroxylase (fatty acid hydroxylase superfamily)
MSFCTLFIARDVTTRRVVILAIIVGALVMLAYEQMRPARKWPQVETWWVRSLAINGIQVGVVFLAGATWEKWVHARPSLFSVGDLPFASELAITYLGYAMWLYWWHRARHAFGPLWRWVHQMHHSPARIEVLTSFYKHPLEIVADSVLGAAVMFIVLGASKEAAFIASNVSGILGLFYHWNIKTPRWLGYIVQRPESHCVHHERGVHAFNYSELPIIDIVFRTFRNPPTFEGECGFGDERERKLAPLLLGSDVTK